MTYSRFTKKNTWYQEKGVTRMNGNILTVKEAAEFINASTGTIYTMVRLGEIPHFRVRGKILFNREVLEAFTRGEYNQKQLVGN